MSDGVKSRGGLGGFLTSLRTREPPRNPAQAGVSAPASSSPPAAGWALDGQDSQRRLAELSASAQRYRANLAQQLVAPDAVVQAALRGAVVPPKSHPYVRYVDALRSELESRGLPSSARGVNIFVAGEGVIRTGQDVEVSEHGQHVAQTLAGPVGLAQGATISAMVRHRRPGDAPIPVPLTSDVEARALQTYDTSQTKLRGGTLQLDEVGRAGASEVFSLLVRRRQHVNDVMQVAPRDGRTSLVNMSNSIELFNISKFLTEDLLKPPHASPAVRALAKELGLAYPIKPSDTAAVQRAVSDRVRAELAKPENARALEAERQALTQDVARAREQGLLVFKAAGNNLDVATALGRVDDARQLDAVPGMILVGAIDLKNDPLSQKDDEVATFSMVGATLGAVGVKVPLGGGDVDGTSFSTPFSVSVAALMVAANPRISPYDVERILKETSVAVKGGLNEVDPVRAVEEAKRSAATSQR